MTTVESDYYAFMNFDPEAASLGLSHYLQFFTTGPVLELACGRGEFLRLLRERGIDARGVDVDAGMVDAARAGGLEVALADALDHLAEVPDGSLGGLFCAHFLEHLVAPDVERVYVEASRVLAPGGVFVAAVPNAGCLSVLGYDFWRDPTHVRFYDPVVLSFFAQRAGLTVVAQGENPLNHAGPPPETYPAEIPGVPGVTDDLDRVRQLLSVRGDNPAGKVAAQAARVGRTYTATDALSALADLVGLLDEHLSQTQHHLFTLRSSYIALLERLYPANEVFVAARRQSLVHDAASNDA